MLKLFVGDPSEAARGSSSPGVNYTPNNNNYYNYRVNHPPSSLVSGSRDARNISTPLDRPPPPPPPPLGRRQTASNLHVSQSVLFLYNTSNLFGVR